MSNNNNNNLKEKFGAFGERMKIRSEEVGRKMSMGMSSMSFKMKEFFQGQNMADKIVDEATSGTMEGPDWSTNIEICDMINSGRANSVEVIRAIKRRIMTKNQRVQFYALILLETVVKNCERAFFEVAAERVLDEMVRLIDDPQTGVMNRNKALVLIESWGEMGDQLRYLPAYEETYKSLKSRGILFPARDTESLTPIFTPPPTVPQQQPYVPQHQPYATQRQPYVPQQQPHVNSAPVYREVPVYTFTEEQIRKAFDVAQNSLELLSSMLSASPQKEALQDELILSLVQQCQQSLQIVQRIIDTATGDVVLFEALNLNDELQKVLRRYDELTRSAEAPHEAEEPAMIPVTIEAEISGHVVVDSPSAGAAATSRASDGAENVAPRGGHVPRKQEDDDDDLSTF